MSRPNFSRKEILQAAELKGAHIPYDAIIEEGEWHYCINRDFFISYKEVEQLLKSPAVVGYHFSADEFKNLLNNGHESKEGIANGCCRHCNISRHYWHKWVCTRFKKT